VKTIGVKLGGLHHPVRLGRCVPASKSMERKKYKYHHLFLRSHTGLHRLSKQPIIKWHQYYIRMSSQNNDRSYRHHLRVSSHLIQWCWTSIYKKQLYTATRGWKLGREPVVTRPKQEKTIRKNKQHHQQK